VFNCHNLLFAGDYEQGWSPESDAPPLNSARARALFAAGLLKYRAAATVNVVPLAATVDAGGCVVASATLAPHDVVLMECPGIL
jgi:hypothetical protein